jgi:hypothetical protein
LKETGSFDHDAIVLLPELKQAMIAQRSAGLKKPLGTQVKSADGWTTNIKTCSYLSIGPASESLNLGEGLEADISCKATRVIFSKPSTAVFDIQAVIGPDALNIHPGGIGYHEVRFAPQVGSQELFPGIDSPNPEPGDLFYSVLGTVVLSDPDLISRDVGTLELSSDTEQDFNRFFDATQGDPNAFSNSTIRMTYFSATTITTLGLGDIAPITDISRLLVATEAVLGLIVIGLFLNALGSKYLRSMIQKVK